MESAIIWKVPLPRPRLGVDKSGQGAPSKCRQTSATDSSLPTSHWSPRLWHLSLSRRKMSSIFLILLSTPFPVDSSQPRQQLLTWIYWGEGCAGEWQGMLDQQCQVWKSLTFVHSTCYLPRSCCNELQLGRFLSDSCIPEG